MKKTQKQILIKRVYCDQKTISKNFVRHLERWHAQENSVISIMKFPKNSKQRKAALAKLRNETNFDLYLEGEIDPNRKQVKTNSPNTFYYPCIYCKGLFKKTYLRHVKKCHYQNNKKSNENCVAKSQTFTVCQADPVNVISKLNVKEKVFDMMRGDEISFEAKKDLLNVCFGDSYLKKHRKERSTYTCSNRMRQLSRLLIEFRKLSNNQKVDFTSKSILHPKHFELVVTAVRNISGYDPSKKTFTSPSLAMHLGTSLKIV